MSEQKGWWIKVNGPSKRGKFRPIIMFNDTQRAITPVNVTFDTKENALKEGEAILAAGNSDAYKSGERAGGNLARKRAENEHERGYSEGREDGFGEGDRRGFKKGLLTMVILAAVAFGIVEFSGLLSG